jgi:hypothetical protein
MSDKDLSVEFGGDSLKLFTLVDGVPVINPVLRALAPFKELIIRDKGSKGDFDGRKKTIANKEIQFIYFKYHPNSSYKENSSQSTIDEDIKRGLELPEDWKEDESVIAAAKFFTTTLYVSATRKVLEMARDSLFLTADMISKYQQSVSKAVNKEFKFDNPDEYEAEQDRIKVLMGLVNSLLKISMELPKAVESLENTRMKTNKESETAGYTTKKVVDSDQLPGTYLN